jgi:transposase-like protein
MQDNQIFCRRCNSAASSRAGYVGKEQRYKCKDCGYHFTMNRRGFSPEIKRLAIHLYLEGMGFRAIGRILGVSDVAVAKWIAPGRDHLDPLRKKNLRMDELNKYQHFFITREIYNKYGWLLIGTEDNAGECLLGSYTLGNYKLY